MRKRYKVSFTIDREVNAESKEEAQELALEEILDGNGYYVHDYIDFESAKVIWDAVKEDDD